MSYNCILAILYIGNYAVWRHHDSLLESRTVVTQQYLCVANIKQVVIPLAL